MNIFVPLLRQLAKTFTARFCLPGDEHGDVLADDRLLSTSSGNSTDAVLKFRLYPKRRAVDGLNGAENSSISNFQENKMYIGAKTTYNVIDYYLTAVYCDQANRPNLPVY